MIPDGAPAELGDCFAERRSVMVAGRLVEIQAFGLERMQQYTDFIAPAFDNAMAFLFSIANQPDAANAIILASTEHTEPLPQEFVLGLSPPERVRLVLEIQKTNEHAFRWALLVQSQMTESLIRMAGAGPTPSSISASTDSPTPDDSLRAPPGSSSGPSPAPNGAASASVQ